MKGETAMSCMFCQQPGSEGSQVGGKARLFEAELATSVSRRVGEAAARARLRRPRLPYTGKLQRGMGRRTHSRRCEDSTKPLVMFAI